VAEPGVIGEALSSADQTETMQPWRRRGRLVRGLSRAGTTRHIHGWFNPVGGL